MRSRTVPRRTFLSILLLVLVLSHSYAENIRGTLAGTVAGGGETVSFKPEQLVVLDGSGITDVHAGLEIRVDIPAGIRRFQNSFALFIYRNVQPSPSLGGPAYSGTRAYMRLLPSREALFVRIPLYQDHGISSDALTDVLPNPVDAGHFPLIVTVLPVMKGVPDSAFNQELRLTASEIWKNEGTLTVDVANPSGDPGEIIELTVDGNAAEIGSSITLEAGLHRIVVTSTHAPTVEKTVAVEPGRTENVEIALDYTPPEISLMIPEGAEVFLDGNRVEAPGPMSIMSSEPGEHTVKYVLGGLEVSRSFSIRPGGKVRIDLLFEIDIVDYGDDSGNRYGAGDG